MKLHLFESGKNIKEGQKLRGRQIIRERISFNKQIIDSQTFITTVDSVEGHRRVTLTLMENYETTSI